MARFNQLFTKAEKETLYKRFDTTRIYLAEVMDTRSVLRAGDMKVWLYGSAIDKTDQSKWVTASYCSPFFGTTPYENNTTIDFETNPTSFGMWFPMPYVGNKVFVFFPNVNGESSRAYWFGCPMNGYENSMLPGIPGQFFDENHTPQTEMNNKNADESYSGRGQTLSVRENARAEYTPLKDALKEQGLEKDKLRGYSTAGSKRESPSMCYGITSPLGNTFVIDDGWLPTDNRTTWNMTGSSTSYASDGKEISKSSVSRHNAGFRFRTRNGTQILISDDGNIYMINRDGSAWAEITDDGRLQGYAKTSADIACDGDINFNSKKKIIMEADEGFAFKSSGGGISIETAGDINVSSPHVNTNAIINSPEINAKLGNIESFESKMAQCNGVFSGTLDGTAYFATSAGMIPTPQPTPNVNEVTYPDVIVEETKTIAGMDGSTQSVINSVCPTHEPYDGHNKNDDIPELSINNEAMNDESYYSYGSGSSNVVSNSVSEVCPNTEDAESDGTIPQQNLSEHFTLAQLCYSATAKAKGISNVPSNEQIGKLQALAQNILEKVWSHYDQQVVINSGYRGAALNAAVGGATSSQHSKGEAADFEINGVDNYDLACWIRDNLDFDQLILEFASGGGNNGWVHCSWKDSGRRKQCLTINKSGTRSGLIRT
jgi:hypothetical protein